MYLSTMTLAVLMLLMLDVVCGDVTDRTRLTSQARTASAKTRSVTRDVAGAREDKDKTGPTARGGIFRKMNLNFKTLTNKPPKTSRWAPAAKRQSGSEPGEVLYVDVPSSSRRAGIKQVSLVRRDRNMFLVPTDRLSAPRPKWSKFSLRNMLGSAKGGAVKGRVATKFREGDVERMQKKLIENLDAEVVNLRRKLKGTMATSSVINDVGLGGGSRRGNVKIEDIIGGGKKDYVAKDLMVHVHSHNSIPKPYHESNVPTNTRDRDPHDDLTRRYNNTSSSVVTSKRFSRAKVTKDHRDRRKARTMNEYLEKMKKHTYTFLNPADRSRNKREIKAWKNNWYSSKSISTADQHPKRAITLNTHKHVLPRPTTHRQILRRRTVLYNEDTCSKYCGKSLKNKRNAMETEVDDAANATKMATSDDPANQVSTLMFPLIEEVYNKSEMRQCGEETRPCKKSKGSSKSCAEVGPGISPTCNNFPFQPQAAKEGKTQKKKKCKKPKKSKCDRAKAANNKGCKHTDTAACRPAYNNFQAQYNRNGGYVIGNRRPDNRGRGCFWKNYSAYKEKKKQQYTARSKHQPYFQTPYNNFGESRCMSPYSARNFSANITPKVCKLNVNVQTNYVDSNNQKDGQKPSKYASDPSAADLLKPDIDMLLKVDEVPYFNTPALNRCLANNTDGLGICPPGVETKSGDMKNSSVISFNRDDDLSGLITRLLNNVDARIQNNGQGNAGGANTAPMSATPSVVQATPWTQYSPGSASPYGLVHSASFTPGLARGCAYTGAPVGTRSNVDFGNADDQMEAKLHSMDLKELSNLLKLLQQEIDVKCHKREECGSNGNGPTDMESALTADQWLPVDAVGNGHRPECGTLAVKAETKRRNLDLNDLGHFLRVLKEEIEKKKSFAQQSTGEQRSANKALSSADGSSLDANDPRFDRGGGTQTKQIHVDPTVLGNLLSGLMQHVNGDGMAATRDAAPVVVVPHVVQVASITEAPAEMSSTRPPRPTYVQRADLTWEKIDANSDVSSTTTSSPMENYFSQVEKSNKEHIGLFKKLSLKRNKNKDKNKYKNLQAIALSKNAELEFLLSLNRIKQGLMEDPKKSIDEEEERRLEEFKKTLKPKKHYKLKKVRS